MKTFFIIVSAVMTVLFIFFTMFVVNEMIKSGHRLGLWSIIINIPMSAIYLFALMIYLNALNVATEVEYIESAEIVKKYGLPVKNHPIGGLQVCYFDLKTQKGILTFQLKRSEDFDLWLSKKIGDKLTVKYKIGKLFKKNATKYEFVHS